MKPGIKIALLYAPLALALCAIGINLWTRTQMVQADPLMAGHFIGPIEGIDERGNQVVVPDSRCHLIRYGSSDCPACHSDWDEWTTMRSAMLAKGCNVTEFAPSANLLEDRGPEAGIYRLTSLNPEFIARNRFSATPTIILVDQYWRVLWSQGGALRSSELSATIAEQPSSMLMALLKPVELHPPHPSQAISKASAPPAPASLDARTVQIPVADSPTDGPASAPVVVVEFADFQCPYCALVARPLRQLRAKYPNGVRLVYKQYPLEFHEYARKAAGLSVVAAQRGRFWPVYDELFKASPELSESILSQTATDAGMDAGKLGELVRSTNVQHQIDGDIQLGKSVGVNATPTLFVNGRLYHGPIDPANLERLVTQELARQAPIPHAGQ